MNENELKKNIDVTTKEDSTPQEESPSSEETQETVAPESTPEPMTQAEDVPESQASLPESPTVKRRSSVLPILICLTFIVVSVCIFGQDINLL